MSDLSTLSSGKSVHLNDRCLTTLGSLAHVLREVLVRAARGTRLHGTTLLVVSQRLETGRYSSHSICWPLADLT